MGLDNLPKGFKVKEKNSVEEPETVLGEEIFVMEAVFGITNDQLQVAIEQGVLQTDKYHIEVIV